MLHRAGFVPIVLFRERFHRLPSAMSDLVKQRQMVTRAFDMLQAEGFDVVRPRPARPQPATP